MNRVLVPNRGLFTTSYLFAEPLRKKKRIDPQVLKRRTERKLRKLEKEIRRLESTKKQLKPIIEANNELKRMTKLWSIYKSEERVTELKSIKSMVYSQNRALNELRKESQELYESAISVDNDLMPFKVEDVKKETPKIDNYETPDGRITDLTKQWTM
jgi:large subunit ribosomal protein L40